MPLNVLPVFVIGSKQVNMRIFFCTDLITKKKKTQTKKQSQQKGQKVAAVVLFAK